MAAITTPAGTWQPSATINAYPIRDAQRAEPLAASITSAAAGSDGSVTLSNAGLLAGVSYRAIGPGPSGVTRVVVITPA